MVTKQANVTATNIGQTVFEVHNSRIDSISNLVVKNCLQAIEIISSSSVNITSSQFTNLGSSKFQSGSGIHLENSNLTVTNSSFVNNVAKNGAGLYLD